MSAEDVTWRRSALGDEFKGDLRHYYRLGRWNYFLASSFRLGTVLASILAGGLKILPRYQKISEICPRR